MEGLASGGVWQVTGYDCKGLLLWQGETKSSFPWGILKWVKCTVLKFSL